VIKNGVNNVQPNNNVTAIAEEAAAAENTSTQVDDPTTEILVSSNQVDCELTTF